MRVTFLLLISFFLLLLLGGLRIECVRLKKCSRYVSHEICCWQRLYWHLRSLQLFLGIFTRERKAIFRLDFHASYHRLHKKDVLKFPSSRQSIPSRIWQIQAWRCHLHIHTQTFASMSNSVVQEWKKHYLETHFCSTLNRKMRTRWLGAFTSRLTVGFSWVATWILNGKFLYTFIMIGGFRSKILFVHSIYAWFPKQDRRQKSHSDKK